MEDTLVNDPPERLGLKIIEGPERGKVFNVSEPGGYIIGRGDDCDIALNIENKQASRKHARLVVTLDSARVVDLGSANGVWLKDGERVKEAVLSPGVEFRIGDNLLALENYGDFDPEVTQYARPVRGRSETGWFSSRVRIVVYAIALVLVLFFFYSMLTGKGKKGREAEAPKPPAQGELRQAPTPTPTPMPTAKTPTPPPRETQAPTATPPPSTAIPTAAPTMAPDAAHGEAHPEKAQEHFRQGMFFYRTGKLRRALDEFDAAYRLDTANESTRKWVLRVEKELDGEIDKHYRQAILAVKYLRYDEARREFKLVMQWVRDPEDERYRTAAQNLAELEGK